MNEKLNQKESEKQKLQLRIQDLEDELNLEKVLLESKFQQEFEMKMQDTMDEVNRLLTDNEETMNENNRNCD